MHTDNLPFRPSVFDRVFYWIGKRSRRRLVYLGVYAAALLITAAAFVVEGSWDTEALVVSLLNGAWAIVLYAAIHYIDSESIRATERFREVYEGTDEEFAADAYRLTTMPARPAFWVWLISAFIFLGMGLFEQGVAGFESMAARAIQAPVIAFSYASGPLLVYHTLRMLTGVARLLRDGRVNVFHLHPLYGFSRVTAKVGFIWVGVQAFNGASELALTLDGGLNTEFWIGAIITLPLAVITFVFPLRETHDRIVRAKADALAENSDHIERIRQRMYKELERDDTAAFKGLDDALTGLLKMATTINAVPSWPWNKGTFRTFFGAIGTPLVVFLAQRLLDSVL